MKQLVKNLIYTLRKFKLASILNVFGLSLAFAAFIIIIIQVRYEYSFDKFHKTSERVFRVSLPDEGIFSIILPRPFIEEIIKSSPHIEAGSILNPFIGEKYLTIDNNGERKGFNKLFITCSPDITEVFAFDILEGKSDCLNNPDHVIIPQSMAHTFFGKESAIGKSIHSEEMVWSKNRNDLVVGGVYRDFPDNTQLHNAIYTAMDPDFAMDNWQASNYVCYLLLDNRESAQMVADNFNKNFDYSKMRWDDAIKRILLTPLTDLYFLNEMQDGSIMKSGSKQSVQIIFLIAILVIIVAGINFMNFSTSLAPIRIKNINTQKVLGCPGIVLRISLISEALFISFISFLLGIVYVWIINNIHMLTFIEADLNLINNLDILFLCAMIAIITGFLSGLYPAFYMTSVPPALALKGNFGLSPVGRKLRLVLVGFQYVISIGLIIASSFIWLQSRYMQNYSLGFDKDQIIIVNLNQEFYNEHHEGYVNRLKSYPGIEDVAFSIQKLGAQDSYSTSGITYNEETFHCYVLNVSWNFAEVMGIPLMEGRYPTPSDAKSEKMIFLVNREINSKYGLGLNPSLEIFGTESAVIGVVDNAKFTSLRKKIDNQVLFIDGNNSLPVSYVRIKAGTNYSEAINHIEKTIAQIDPTYPVSIEFYDTLFGQLYQKEENLRKMITVFCILAILISIVGVFGLVIFETEYKRKEIGVRKVFGSTIGEVSLLFNKLYIRIILVCFLIVIPIIYYSINKWLEGFVYKIPVYWWVFLASGFLILVITLFIVSFQSWKAARANPIDSLKDE